MVGLRVCWCFGVSVLGMCDDRSDACVSVLGMCDDRSDVCVLVL
jgi:hypothetical protein